MTLTVPVLIVLIVIAAVCGAVGKAVGGRGRGGFITAVALGVIGALFLPWVAQQFGLSEPLLIQIGSQPFPIVWSITGAALVVALLHYLSGWRWVRT